jgi:mono/diheme cytochrome c family protein
MWNESRVKPYEESRLPGAASSARALPAGAVARGELWRGDPVATGRGADGKLLKEIPIPVTKAMLSRGQERFNIYCAPCHSRVGDGEGMIVKRGFPHPPDYALLRLKNANVGHFYDVITNGYGVMYSYASRVPVRDRWAIAAYIRVLQKLRPTVMVDEWEAQRVRARQLGIGGGQPPEGAPVAPGAVTPGGGRALPEGR